MPLDGSDREMLNTLHEIISKQMNHDKRLERLETLEFEKAAKSYGCISWLDYDHPTSDPTARVDVPASFVPATSYGWTQLTAWYMLAGEGAGNKTLHMTFNGIVAGYGYTYKYARGGAATIISADAQASYIIANLRNDEYTAGWVHVPFFPVPVNMHTWGDWVCKDVTQEAGSQVEKGEYGGVNDSVFARVTRIDMFASAGDITGYVYLYGWCPTWTIGSGPPD